MARALARQAFDLSTRAAAAAAYARVREHWIAYDMWWINFGTKEGDEAGIPDE